MKHIFINFSREFIINQPQIIYHIQQIKLNYSKVENYILIVEI